MRGYMFKSRIGALVFVGGILFAVFRMVGTEENAGDLLTATGQLEEKRAAARGQGAPEPAQNQSANAPAETGGWGDGGFGEEK
ncbi:hypothetical protein [Aurantiacibacter sp. D1-12]|uniref:hypothetical protein n=1 Tax=Aurantiacibacter sp. D1-12 TaxID=2993658 RepID=UPI00237C5E65|nr:hypothetical protein [Aurantiacibacter sp. D1-12]MDE1468549.1 hypothetical protein [Aurantiacibacter sp. D1-12]